MADFDRFERALGVALHLDAEAGAIPFDPRQIAGVAIERGGQGRVTTIRRAATSPQVRWLLAAALLAAALVAILLGTGAPPVRECSLATWETIGPARGPFQTKPGQRGPETVTFAVGDPNGSLGGIDVTISVTTAPLGTPVPVQLGRGQPAGTVVIVGNSLEALGTSIEASVPGAAQARGEVMISGEPGLRYAGVAQQTYVGPLAAVAVTIYGDRVFVATEHFAFDAPFDALDAGRFDSFLASVRFTC